MTPIEHINRISRKLPGVWERYAHLLRGKGKDLPDWPPWCFCPISGAISILTAGRPAQEIDVAALMSHGIQPSELAGLAAWRSTRGVYRFAPEVYQALITTPVDSIPSEALKALPEWCVYIETPDGFPQMPDAIGFWAFLDFSTADGRCDLYLLPNRSQSPLMIPEIVHLSQGATLQDGIKAAVDEALKNAQRWKMGDEAIDGFLDIRLDAKAQAEALAPLLSLLLYLCSETPDIKDAAGKRGAPGKTEPLTKTRSRPDGAFFQADRDTVWETAFNLERQLKAARRASYSPEHLYNVTPHIRRAHWHSFWTGPKAEPAKRVVKLRWLPPIPVNADLGETPSETIRNVK